MYTFKKIELYFSLFILLKLLAMNTPVNNTPLNCPPAPTGKGHFEWFDDGWYELDALVGQELPPDDDVSPRDLGETFDRVNQTELLMYLDRESSLPRDGNSYQTPKRSRKSSSPPPLRRKMNRPDFLLSVGGSCLDWMLFQSPFSPPRRLKRSGLYFLLNRDRSRLSLALRQPIFS